MNATLCQNNVRLLALHTPILSADFLTFSKETQANSCVIAMTSPDFQKCVNCLQIFGPILARVLLEIFKYMVSADKIGVCKAD